MKKNILFLGVLVVYTGIYSAASKKQAPEVLKVLSFNIDTNAIRTEEGYARDSHPAWRVGARMPKIQAALKKIIETDSPDVIHLQEGRKFITNFGDEVDSITPLMELLYDEGYQVSTEQENPTDRSFAFITAIKKKFIIDDYKKIYFTKTPDRATDHSLPLEKVKEHNYGEEWECCTYITEFHDAQGRNYRLKNLHLRLGELHRKQACEILLQDTEQAISRDPNVLEVIAGDFNTFSDWGGPAQLEIMARNGVLEEVTQDLKLPHGARIDSTHVAYPYDFAADEKRLNAQSLKDHEKPLAKVLLSMPPLDRKQKIEELFKKECRALGSHFDRVYQRGFGNSKVTLLPLPLFDDFDATRFGDEAYVKDFVVRHLEDGPAFASDHQPLLAEFELP